MDEIRAPDDSDLYDRDFDRWIDLQATHLRDGRYHLLDMVHLIDEIESLGKSQMFALRSSYALIAMHLLKQIKQPEKASASWENTINRERGNVVELLEEIRALSQSVKRLSQKPTRGRAPMPHSRRNCPCARCRSILPSRCCKSNRRRGSLLAFQAGRAAPRPRQRRGVVAPTWATRY